MKKIILLPAFLIMVAAQLYMPIRLVLNSENILETGKEFKFQTASVYPQTPARGSYVSLTFQGNTIPVDSSDVWNQNEEIYVVLKTDSSGFANIDYVTKERPSAEIDFVKAFVDYVIQDSISSLVVRYPFDRFYLEADPKSSERSYYSEVRPDGSSNTYALVVIKEGDAIVVDVFIDNVSIKEQKHEQ